MLKHSIKFLFTQPLLTGAQPSLVQSAHFFDSQGIFRNNLQGVSYLV
jgi:hypothetical protein